MENFSDKLKNRLRGRSVLVGIGNTMRGDDGFGPHLVAALKDKVVFDLVDCGTAPENHIFPILERNPETVVFLDAANFGGAPGEIRVLEMSEVAEISFSTHSASLNLLADLFREANPLLNICIVAIQPKDTALGARMSEEVRQGIAALKKTFKKIGPSKKSFWSFFQRTA
jgi:hydrogenase 3 maturation protease